MTFFNNNHGNNSNRNEKVIDKFNDTLRPFSERDTNTMGYHNEPTVERPVDNLAILNALDSMDSYLELHQAKVGSINYTALFNNEYEHFIKTLCDSVTKTLLKTDPHHQPHLQVEEIDFTYTCVDFVGPDGERHRPANNGLSPTNMLTSSFYGSRIYKLLTKLNIDISMVRISSAMVIQSCQPTVTISFRYHVYQLLTKLTEFRKEVELEHREQTVQKTLFNINNKILPMIADIYKYAGSLGQIDEALKEIDALHTKVDELLKAKEEKPKTVRKTRGAAKPKPDTDDKSSTDDKSE